MFLGHDSMGLAMAQARHIGCSAQFYTVGTITSPGYQQLAGEAAEGALVAYWEAPESPQLERFHSLFKEKTGRPPILDLATTPSYDATKLLLEAIRQSIEPDGTITVEKVRKALLRVEKYQGLSGTLTIDPDGAVRSIQEKIYQYKDGRLS